MSEQAEGQNFFIVGNSRSGTTMMMRILDAHGDIHSINEPHFYESMWSPKDDQVLLQDKEANQLLAKLLTGQRDGFFSKVEPGKYDEEIEGIKALTPSHSCTRLAVFRTWLQYEAKRAGKQIPCEKTPQNVFYLYELLTHYQAVKVINMVRDPRAVLLSQKRKWRRKFLGGSFITWKEMLRLVINYHPLTIGRLWNSSVDAAQVYRKHPDLLHLKFEDLLEHPEDTVRAVCGFLEIEYQPEMLAIPYAGSSVVKDDSAEKGIRTARADSWKGKLSASEVFLCQLMCRKRMKRWGYEPVRVFPNPLRVIWNVLFFPVKLVLALLMNLNRMRSITDTLFRRFQSSEA